MSQPKAANPAPEKKTVEEEEQPRSPVRSAWS